MEKYHYFQGRCEANHYLSQNPVIYVSNEGEETYKKDRMGCNLVQNKTCERAYTCQLLIDAPVELIPDGVNLRDKKIGE